MIGAARGERVDRVAHETGFDVSGRQRLAGACSTWTTCVSDLHSVGAATIGRGRELQIDAFLKRRVLELLLSPRHAPAGR